MSGYSKKIKLIPALNLHCNNTISDAFKIIDGRFGMVATVIDDNDRLCGIVSEGDLRRAILSGHSLDTPLEKVMNTKPITTIVDELGDEIEFARVVDRLRRICGTGQGRQMMIPVLDDRGIVAGLINSEILQMKEGHDVMTDGVHAGKPHVLVVGGAGYIGSILVRMLLAERWRVRVLDNMLYRQTSLKGIDDDNLLVMLGDVTNINDVVEAIEGIDAIIYLAEIVGDAACYHSPERALKTNYLSVANMACLCAYLNISRFIYASSCSVYGGSSSPDQYISEDSELKAVSYYGRMKILAEKAVLSVSNPLFAPTILRLATVFGYSYRPRFDLVVNTFAKNAFFRKCIEVFGGNQWRPNIYVSDVARAIIKTLKAPLDKVSRQVFNVGSTKENYTVTEIARLASGVFQGVEIKQNDNVKDLRNYRVSFSKFEEAVQFNDCTTVLDGLKELKSIFEKGKIKDPDAPRYSNVEAMKELVKG